VRPKFKKCIFDFYYTKAFLTIPASRGKAFLHFSQTRSGGSATVGGITVSLPASIMPFDGSMSKMQWPWQMFVSGDTTPGCGARLTPDCKRGFGGSLVPTLHILQLLEERDFSAMPPGFIVPSGTAMWVLMSFNSQENRWIAADGAEAGNIHQRIGENNQVTTVFGHTFCGSFREGYHFSEATIAYVQSGNEHYFAHVCLLQSIELQFAPLLMNQEATDVVDNNGGLEMFFEESTFQGDLFDFDFSGEVGESMEFFCKDMQLEPFVQQNIDYDVVDDDRMSMATTPVASVHKMLADKEFASPINFTFDGPEALDFSSVANEYNTHDMSIFKKGHVVLADKKQEIWPCKPSTDHGAVLVEVEMDVPEIDMDMPRKKVCVPKKDIVMPHDIITPNIEHVKLDMTFGQGLGGKKDDMESVEPMPAMTSLQDKMVLSAKIKKFLQRFEEFRRKYFAE